MARKPSRNAVARFTVEEARIVRELVAVEYREEADLANTLARKLPKTPDCQASDATWDTYLTARKPYADSLGRAVLLAEIDARISDAIAAAKRKRRG